MPALVTSFAFGLLFAGGATAAGSGASADYLGGDPIPPLMVVQPAPPETVFAPPPVTAPGEGFNEGALSVEIGAFVTTNYVFRGFQPLGNGSDAANYQFDATLRFDLGRLPDPFLRILTNTSEAESVTNFQVIRPQVGLIWESDAFTATFAHQAFTYPDNDELDTAEVFLDVRIRDGVFFGEDRPILGPYVFAAYDYDTFNGLYVEVGLERTFRVADTNLFLTAHGATAFVSGLEGLFATNPDDPQGDGFAFYQVGLTARYELNTLINLSRRYGQFGVQGFIYYTDGIDNRLRSDTQLWGGGGIVFRY